MCKCLSCEKVKKYIALILIVLYLSIHLLMSKASAESINEYKAEIPAQNIIKSRLEFNSNNYSRSYVLGPNDVISIFVYDSEEFNQVNIRIQPNGNIIITPLGQIKVSGMTIENLHILLVNKYKKYLKEPQVTVRLDETRPFVVYVTGAVLNPGSYEMSTNTSNNQNLNNSKSEVMPERKSPLLSNVLVAAGGIQFDADLEHIKITNSFDNSEFNANLMDILEKGASNQDIYLMSGDTVYIPKLPTPLAVSEEKYKKYATATFSPKIIPVKVYGYVNNPGLIKLDSSASITLSSAITAAGGYLTDSAYAPKKIFISRADVSGKLVTRVVNPMSNDVTLMPNDIVYVPEKSRPLVGKTFDYMMRVLNPVNTFANTYNNWALMSDPHRYQVIGK